MADYIDVLLFSAAGGLISLVGGLFLLRNNKRATHMVSYATPFAAGALLAAAFLDLLPEAAHQGNIEHALRATVAGIILFFLLERFLRWFHHHHDEKDKPHKDANASLIVAGDTLHNFIDGIAIAAGFLVSVPSGIIVTLAVAAHEIPQEIGDFALLLKKGYSKRKVVIVNLLSAVATVVAALAFFRIGEAGLSYLDIVLGLTAGFFIYIAVSDIIPEIHRHETRRIAGPHTLLLIGGLLTVGLVTTTLHDYIDTHRHEHESSQHEREEAHHDEHEAGEEHHEEHNEDHEAHDEAHEPEPPHEHQH
ncbi:MAG: ZIP family metal transporter [Candidatus Saccharibacteria bacterium]|nr:ZIP family metal transporter [Candidatus Saccharibacteria bacterium]